MNFNSYAVREVASDNVTSSDSLELLQTIFCLADFAIIAPLPCDILMPEGDLPLLCTPWFASAKHVNFKSPCDRPRCILNSCVPLKYSSTLSSLFLSCSAGANTLVVKKMIGSEASGLVLVTA